MSKRKTFTEHLAKKASKEAKAIGKGVAREGGRIASGFVRSLLNVFSPFR